MSDLSVPENNKLIADFMSPNVPHYLFKSELKYHTSWDWLMPVVEKIISMEDADFDLTIKFGITDDFITFRTRESYNNSHWNWRLVICEENKGIETVYKTIVEFIKWYNKKQEA